MAKRKQVSSTANPGSKRSVNARGCNEQAPTFGRTHESKQPERHAAELRCDAASRALFCWAISTCLLDQKNIFKHIKDQPVPPKKMLYIVLCFM
jgi:hypothetical protein